MQSRFSTPRRWALAVVIGLAALGTSQISLRGQDAARDDVVIAQLERQGNAFFERLLEGESDEAFEGLLTGSPIAARAESVRDLTDKTAQLESRYGRYRGFERIETRRLGQDLISFRYLLKCENYPVVWYMTFYRTSQSINGSPTRESWKLIALKFDTKFEQLTR